MSIRVLLIIPTLERGGAEKQLTLLARELSRGEFDVHICALTRGGPLGADLAEDAIPVQVVGKRWKVDPAAYWRLRRYIGRLAPDLVHTWIFAANCYGRQAAFSAGVPRIVAGERCVDRWKVWHELAIDRYLARRTDRIAANSVAVRDFYVRRGIPAEKFVIIPNGVPIFHATETLDRQALLRSLGLPAECRLIGAVGRLWPQKRLKDLVWAAELLKTIRDDTHLLIVGEGPQRWRLQRYCELVGVDDRVHLLGGRDDVNDLLPHFDCLWLASGYEGQSNAVMEAMAAGIPVIATDIPGNLDLITSAESGWLVPVGDRAAFARLTNQLLDDPPLAERIGRAGQERMREHFSVARMARRYGELYRELTC